MMLELNNYYIQEFEIFTDLFTNIFVITFSVNRLFNTGFLLQTSEWNHPRKVGAIGRIARYTCRRAVVLDGWEYWKGGNGGTDEMRTGVILTGVIGPGDQTGRPYINLFLDAMTGFLHKWPNKTITNSRTKSSQITERNRHKWPTL